MHNKHILRIEATSHENAQINASEAIDSWGDENNYCKIIASICIDDTEMDSSLKVIKKVGKLKNTTMFEAYKEALTDLIRTHKPYNMTEIGMTFVKFGLQLIKEESFYTISQNTNSLTSYSMKEAVKELHARIYLSLDKEFDMWNQDFRSWELDEFGLTDLIEYGPSNDPSKIKIYLVIIDMHS